MGRTAALADNGYCACEHFTKSFKCGRGEPFNRAFNFSHCGSSLDFWQPECP
jgi:hypothetical protein